MRARPARAVLSSLGIAIGIAAMIAVVGICASSREQLNQQLASLGTNLLTAQAGKDVLGKETPPPADTVGKIRLIDGVGAASSVGVLPQEAYRSSLSDPAATGGLTAMAADLALLDMVAGKIQSSTPPPSWARTPPTAARSS